MHRKIEETPEREKMLIRLKELRLERGYSMTQAARKIGIYCCRSCFVDFWYIYMV